jgi:hypothetical protein
MQKIALAALILAAFTSAQATDVGLEAGHSYTSTPNDTVRLVIDQPIAGGLTVQGNYTTDVTGLGKTNKFGASLGYDLPLGSFTITPRIGAAYTTVEGSSLKAYGVTGAVDAAYPLTKSLSLVVGDEYTSYQARTPGLSANTVYGGVKVNF